ncbi:MAG TPA: hypothetical protein VFZ16_15330 [Hyphomicrobiaceae bacterium]|nr:hypothetical protein [Hyphomicrobiaceae bacterium]
MRKDHVRTIARGFKSEREDWIMTMNNDQVTRASALRAGSAKRISMRR